VNSVSPSKAGERQRLLSLTERAEVAEIKATSKRLSEEYFHERKKFFSEFSVVSSVAGEKKISRDMDYELNQISSKILEAAIIVHRELGPGLSESVYTTCLGIELKNMDLEVRSEVPLPVVYRGQNVTEEGFRLDLLVEDQVVVELKSVEKIQPIHQKQLLTYLRLANKPLGLLINFNATLLKDGITRIINTKKDDKGSGRSAD